MTTLDACVRIIGEVVWPAVTLTAVFLLRKQLADLIVRLRSLKAGVVQADFNEQAAAANDLAEAIIPHAPELVPKGSARDVSANDEDDPSRREMGLTTDPSLADLLEEAHRHPVGGVVRAWSVLLSATGQADPARTAYRLQNAGLVDDDIRILAKRLKNLRARVVHGGQIPSKEAARDFVEAAWRLAAALRAGLMTMGRQLADETLDDRRGKLWAEVQKLKPDDPVLQWLIDVMEARERWPDSVNKGVGEERSSTKPPSPR